MSDIMYKLSGKALFTAVGSDIVALSIDDGQCYGMEKVSAAVWRLLETPMSLDQLCERLMRQYDVSAETCRAETGRLIEQLQGEGLIEVVQPAS